jgi:hypothetical protein
LRSRNETAKGKFVPDPGFGCTILAFGVFGTAVYSITGFQYSLPQEMGKDIGIALGNGAIVLLGCATSAVASSLKKLERRLDQLESDSAD